MKKIAYSALVIFTLTLGSHQSLKASDHTPPPSYRTNSTVVGVINYGPGVIVPYDNWSGRDARLRYTTWYVMRPLNKTFPNIVIDRYSGYFLETVFEAAYLDVVSEKLEATYVFEHDENVNVVLPAVTLPW